MAKTKARTKMNPRTAPPSATNKSNSTLSNLREGSNLWYKICVLIYDLKNIKTDKASENRTLQTVDPLYISAPYFSEDEARIVRNAIVDVNQSTSVEEQITRSLHNFFEKRRASGDSRPCGPHDMVPVYLACFGMEKAEIEDEKFLCRVRRSGLGK